MENNNTRLKIEIYNQKKDISKLLDSVSIYEEKIIDHDNSYAKILDNIITEDTNADITYNSGTIPTSSELISDDSSIETIDQNIKTDDDETNVDSNGKSVINNDSSIDNINQTLEPKDDTINTFVTPFNNQSSNTNNYSYSESFVNNENKNYYEFSTNISDMQKAGDVFADSPYSITYYTNFLLYKYDIKDKEIAEKIYQALLDYGKNYYDNYNGANPILKQDEQLIILGIYNIMKNQEDFDISKYPLFQNIQIS